MILPESSSVQGREVMSNYNGVDFSKVLADVGGLSAALFGVSYLYGYVYFKSFFSTIGVDWYSQNLSATFYAIQTIIPFLMLGPITILIYLIFWSVNKERFVIVSYYVFTFLMFVYIFFLAWLDRFGFERCSTSALRKAEACNLLMLAVLGAAMATYIHCLKNSYQKKAFVIAQIFMCLYGALLTVPHTAGYIRGVIVRDTRAVDLPYIIVDQEKWSILDYQKDNSLLIRFVSGSRLETKFLAIEKNVIRSDAPIMFPNRIREK